MQSAKINIKSMANAIISYHLCNTSMQDQTKLSVVWNS